MIRFRLDMEAKESTSLAEHKTITPEPYRNGGNLSANDRSYKKASKSDRKLGNEKQCHTLEMWLSDDYSFSSCLLNPNPTTTITKL